MTLTKLKNVTFELNLHIFIKLNNDLFGMAKISSVNCCTSSLGNIFQPVFMRLVLLLPMIKNFKIYFHRAAHEACAATAIVNIGVTRADGFVPLKINARLGEVL